MRIPHASEPERSPPQAYQTDIILLDIIEYSLMPNEKQYLAIYYLNRILRSITNLLQLRSQTEEERIVEGLVPNGDGSYVILNPGIAGYGPLFALFLRNFLLFNNRALDHLFNGVRTSVHYGSLIPIHFLDTDNFVGDGLNVCSRLLSRAVTARARHFYSDENLVVISEGAWRRFQQRFPLGKPAVQEYLHKISFRSSRSYTVKDKHPQHPDHTFRFIDNAKLIGSAPPRLHSAGAAD